MSRRIVVMMIGRAWAHRAPRCMMLTEDVECEAERLIDVEWTRL